MNPFDDGPNYDAADDHEAAFDTDYQRRHADVRNVVQKAVNQEPLTDDDVALLCWAASVDAREVRRGR